MLIFDQLRKNDPALRALTVLVLAGLAVLMGGLWWVQIVSYRDYQAHLETQSFRTVRIPAVRGKILDAQGRVLAENQPTYNISLYLEELRDAIDDRYFQELRKLRSERDAGMAARQKTLGRKLTRAEKREFGIKAAERVATKREARYSVASNIVAMVSQRIGHPLTLDRTQFERHYGTRLALPYPVLANLDPSQVARFQEGSTNNIGVDLDVQSVRVYPNGRLAGHLLGALKRDDSSAVGEEAYFSYRLPDYRGVLGIEAGYDSLLRGKAGAKSVLVNNMGYRQTESIWSPAEPGSNVRLTLDIDIQQAAEKALPIMGAGTRGAAVVMDVRTGDILALVSSPFVDPNIFVHGFPPGERQRLLDRKLRPQINRATQEQYAPGSIFKIVTGLTALENGLDPNALYTVEPHPRLPGKGVFFVGRRDIIDLAPPGQYNFRRALLKSSNAYFIEHGLRVGIGEIMEVASQFHLGEPFSLPTRQETSGIFPTPETVRAGWSDGDTANICIGQGKMAVTPLQMAVVTAAVANGGNVLWPRLVHSIEPGDPTSMKPAEVTDASRVRTRLKVDPRNLAVIREAMLADVEDPEGTGRSAALPGMRISGKTGTAQVTNQRGSVVDLITWFASFAPYEAPRYAVVVMIESGGSGGGTCAPIARKIYEALLQRNQPVATTAPIAMSGRTGGHR